MPDGLRLVWPIFVELSATRDYEQGIPLPIKHREIEAWCSLYGRRLQIGTLRSLKMLDTAWLKAMNKARAP